MELIDRTLKLPTWNTPLFLHHITDVHISAMGCDRAQLRRDIALIREANERGEHHYWTGGGDYLNAIAHTDKRFDATCVAPAFRPFVGQNLIQAEYEALIEEFAPIKQWCLGLGNGNHEDAVMRRGEIDPIREVCAALNVPHMGYSAFLRLNLTSEDKNDRSATVVVYWHHGRGAARTKGGRVNMLNALRDVADADIYLTGHVHELVSFPATCMSLPRGGKLKLRTRDMLFINGGTYLKSYPAPKAQVGGVFLPHHTVYTDYGEKAAYAPTVIGHWGAKVEMKHGNWRSKTKPQWRVALRLVDFR